MQRELRQTADGSHTLAIAGTDVTYHSHHGAVAESRHVFIEAGLIHILSKQFSRPLRIFEMGFGTGLNALLTLQKAREQNVAVDYIAVEKFPVTVTELAQINYGSLLDAENDFRKIHGCEWGQEIRIDTFFSLQKKQTALEDIQNLSDIHCIYYDAFAPGHQPELWTVSVFEKLFAMLQPGAVLVTYCSKSDVRRAMMAAGFAVEKIPGPKGKREMVRATKIG